MSTTELAEQLVRHVAGAKPEDLVALAQRSRALPEAPSFRGRCLEPAYLSAVAAGDWTPDDEVVLTRALERALAAALPRVSWRHRRALRTALAATTVAALTQSVSDQRWQQRREQYAGPWATTVGALPAPRTASVAS